MKIIVSSQNPVKINASLKAFQTVFPKEKFKIQGISVPSNVSDQPMLNRAKNAFTKSPEADYWVGIEGGIEKYNNEMMTFAWVFVKGRTKLGKGRSASFFLPPKVVELINEGKELGDADDIVFGKNNSKQSTGSIGILTDDLITRTELYIPAVIMALIPFKNLELYQK